MADPVGVRKPDQLTVTTRTAGGSPLVWTFDKRGLTGAMLGSRIVLIGETAPVSSDHLFDRNDASDKVGKLEWGIFSVAGKSRCVVTQTFGQVGFQQDWSVNGEDAICQLTFTNRGPSTIKYPALGGLTAQFPSTPSGIATDLPWDENQLQALGRHFLVPTFWLLLRCTYLAAGGVGVAVLPLDVGDEKHFPWWEPCWQNPEQTHRWFRSVWVRPIEPGRSATFRLGIRVSDDVTFQHMLEPYRAAVKERT